MKKLKTLTVIPFLLICVMLFGAWTYEAPETRYADAPILSTYADETVYYTKREVIEKGITSSYFPHYTPIAGLTNACGAVAGSEIVAFYDKNYTDLIPNWNPCYTNGKYRVKDSTYIPALMTELYTLMRTNVDDVGVSRTDFLNGLQSYVNGKGYQINYQDITSGTGVNYSQYVNAINNGKVVVLFSLPTTVYEFSVGTNSDIIMPTSIAGAHIMVGYDYYQVNYYNANGIFRTDTYLKVAVGMENISTGFIKINSANLEASYIVNIA